MNKKTEHEQDEAKPEPRSGVADETLLSAGFYYEGTQDQGFYIINIGNSEKFSAGFDLVKVNNLIRKLNNAPRPNICNTEENEIWVCWNNHDRNEKCEYELEIESCR